MRKIVILVAVTASLAVVLLLSMRRSDIHHSAERREWKDQAIISIGNDLKDPDLPKKRHESQAGWLTKSIIICEDGSWLAYRAECQKENPKVHDIFVAKASDGRWYYSDFHFCIGAMVLGSQGQPESLASFKARYDIAEFDGSSDEALNPTSGRGRKPAP